MFLLYLGWREKRALYDNSTTHVLLGVARADEVVAKESLKEKSIKIA
jgi:hypothetical protein